VKECSEAAEDTAEVTKTMALWAICSIRWQKPRKLHLLHSM